MVTGGREGRSGFTLIEVVIASVLILILLAGLFSVISYVSYAGASAETQNCAKNIADYTVEYLRARNVTTQTGPTDYDHSAHWYGTTHGTGDGLPGIVDLLGTPLSINSFPVYPDGTTDANPDRKASFSTMQGYVSLRDAPVTNPWAFDPWEANAVLKKIALGGGAFKYQYFDMVTKDPYVVRFGTADAATSPATDVIHQFYAWGDYQSSPNGKPNGWGSETNPKFEATVWGTSPVGDAHFTQDSVREQACHSYSGYRVLVELLAHSNDKSYKHVQYYDVRVRVYWMVAGKERSYGVQTTVTTY